MSTEAFYLRDLGHLLRERALAAKQAAATTYGADKSFEHGRQMAYYEVISLMQQQAAAFDLSLESVSLANFDAERDLL